MQVMLSQDVTWDLHRCGKQIPLANKEGILLVIDRLGIEDKWDHPAVQVFKDRLVPLVAALLPTPNGQNGEMSDTPGIEY